jgi:hypothetical protein
MRKGVTVIEGIKTDKSDRSKYLFFINFSPVIIVTPCCGWARTTGVIECQMGLRFHNFVQIMVFGSFGKAVFKISQPLRVWRL